MERTPIDWRLMAEETSAYLRVDVLERLSALLELPIATDDGKPLANWLLLEEIVNRIEGGMAELDFHRNRVPADF